MNKFKGKGGGKKSFTNPTNGKGGSSMARSRAERPNAHRRLKVQVAVWSATTGRPQYELAQELGITNVYLSRILNGHRGGRYWLDRIDEMTRINRSA